MKFIPYGKQYIDNEDVKVGSCFHSDISTFLYIL